MTSTYYHGDATKKGFQDFNGKKLADKYLDQTWKTLFNQSDLCPKVLQMTNPYESPFIGAKKPYFLINLAELKKMEKWRPGLIAPTAILGNTLTLDFAIAALKGKKI